MDSNITDVEFAAFLQARGLPCKDIIPLDDKLCGFIFDEIPEGLYREFLGGHPIPPELQGIRAYRHLVGDAQKILSVQRGGGRR